MLEAKLLYSIQQSLVKRNNCFKKIESWCLVQAQYVEYKLSHYIDKSFESIFGFVSVLPGAFSTFRWEAIRGDPLKSFFKGLESDKHTAKEANMYLAEDRVMCLEILRKYSKNYVLRYIPSAIALTDPPDDIVLVNTLNSKFNFKNRDKDLYDSNIK